MRVAFTGVLLWATASALFAQRVERVTNRPSDLAGVWDFSTLTPLERPPQFAEKYFLTSAQAGEFQAQRLRTGDQVFGAGPAIDELWLERGGMAAIRGQYVSSLITDPPDGHVPTATSQDEARRASRALAMNRSAGPEDRSLSERCLRSASGPPMIPSADANILQIVQNTDYVAVVIEKFHHTRIIPLDSRPHLRDAIRSYGGDARGKWEGESLVVDTRNFSGNIGLTGRFDGNLHLIERFTRTDANTLLYEFTVDDPTAFTTRWSAAIPMKRTNEHIYEFACHEGNYSLPNILKAARFADQ